MKTAPWSPSDNDLLLLSEHLGYEIQMLFDLGSLALTGGYDTQQTLRNAMVEAFTVHVRQLVDFFWAERTPRNPRDAFASDYFEEYQWKSIRPRRQPELDEEFVGKVGWGVVHLTYGRAHVTAEQKEWRPVNICAAFVPVVLSFIDNVDPAKLDPAWFNEIRSSVERFQALVAGS